MKHIRTISEAYEWVKQQDPDSALTKTAIRSLVLQGTLRHDRVGEKYLITLEALEELIEQETLPESPNAPHDEPRINRLRTIEGAAAWVKVLDPATSLTASAIRRLVKQGELPSLSICSKRLVALEAVEALFSGYGENQSVSSSSGIRRIRI